MPNEKKGPKLQISVVVASLNEADILEDCLDSTSFCDETIVVNFHSTDGTEKIAQAHGARLIPYAPTPTIFEQIHAEVVKQAKHDWILFIDPDERVDEELANELAQRWTKLTQGETAAIYVPWRFYFKGQALRGTIWGLANEKRLLMHKKKVNFTGKVHQGTVPKEGYDSVHIALDKNNVVHHLWMRGYGEWFSKHRRYLRLEGKNRYERGERAGVKALIEIGPRSFVDSFITKKGYRDGFTGLFLSLFWGWYNLRGVAALHKEQKDHVR